MVTRLIELTDEQNASLEHLAATRGRPVSDLLRAGVAAILEDSGRPEPAAARLTPRESELLLAINRGLSVEDFERYRELTARRREGTLTPQEHEDLLRLSEEEEQLQAERIEHLVELARLQGKPLGALMEELGIRPSPHA